MPYILVKMFLCKVCKNGEVKFGTDFCEACRSFHKRHRYRTDFQCRSGTNDCFKNWPSNAIDQSHRYLCQKCRIETCRQIKIAQTNVITQSLMPIPLDTGSEMENSLGQIQSAASILIECFAKSETRRLITWPYSDAREAYIAMAMGCESKLVTMKVFSKHFPFFNNLNLSDRAVLFLTSRFKVFCGENLLQPDGAYVADFKTSVAHHGGRYIPFLSQYAEQAEKTWNFMKNLNLDQVEKSFFLTFLHFGIIPEAMSPKGKRQMSKGLQEIKNCFEAYLKYKEHCRQRKAAFYQVVERVGQESLWRSEIVKTIVIPRLHRCGPTLFTSINNDEPEQYLAALKERNSVIETK